MVGFDYALLREEAVTTKNSFTHQAFMKAMLAVLATRMAAKDGSQVQRAYCPGTATPRRVRLTNLVWRVVSSYRMDRSILRMNRPILRMDRSILRMDWSILRMDRFML